MGAVRHNTTDAHCGAPFFTPWDAVDYLTDEAAIQALVDVALEEGDPEVIASVMRDVLRARSINQIVESTGLDRSTVCGFFSGALTPSPDDIRVIARAVAAY